MYWFIALVVSTSVVLYAQHIELSVLSSGAVRAANGNVSMQGTIGQPIIQAALVRSALPGRSCWTECGAVWRADSQ
jgi:hypothetical protein